MTWTHIANGNNHKIRRNAVPKTREAVTRVMMVQDLKVVVTWKRVKRISLVVKPSREVSVSCPVDTRECIVRAFVANHEKWILDSLQKQSRRLADTPVHLADGETLRLWGRTVPLRLEEGTSTGARLVEDALVISVTEATRGSDETSVDARRAAVRAFLSEELRAALPRVVEHCEVIVSKHASCWRVRYMTSRWGSCNPRTGAITINSALATLPRRCLEEVVTHELCHLWEKSHDARFHSLMDGYYPAWREEQAELNANPPLLR